MSASERMRGAQYNALYRVATGTGLLLGVLLLMGAYGHLEATAASPERAPELLSGEWLAFMLPALVLAVAGLTNVGVCTALWTGASWALQLTLLVTLGAALYLSYLMTVDLPAHPVGIFLALTLSHLVLLGGIRAGLVWPATPESGGPEEEGP